MGRERNPDHRDTLGLKCFIIFFALVISFHLPACKKETPAPQSPPVPSQPKVSAPPGPATPSGQLSIAQAPVYSYNSGGRPDPFAPLILPPQKDVDKKGLRGAQVSDLKLTGIVWDRKEYIALVEGPDKLGYVLKVNDRIGKTARVARINSKSVIFEVQESPYAPQSKIREVELPIKKEE